MSSENIKPNQGMLKPNPPKRPNYDGDWPPKPITTRPPEQNVKQPYELNVTLIRTQDNVWKVHLNDNIVLCAKSLSETLKKLGKVLEILQ